MAITAKFQADFSQFYAATKEAEERVRAFEQGAGKIGPTLDRAVSQAIKPIQRLTREAALLVDAVERTGGVSTLAGSRLDVLGARAQALINKMRALGVEVPASLQSIATKAQGADGTFRSLFASASAGFGGMLKTLGPLAGALGATFSAGAVISFGQAVLADADALVKMSDQTGIGIEALQRLRGVAKESGNTLDDLTRGVSQMQNRLAEGDSSAVGALQQLGLTLEAIRKLSPDQQFYAIARAIREIPDPMERTRVAMDLFGRAGAELLPTLISDVDKLAAQTQVMSDQATRDWDRLGDAIGRSLDRLKAFLAGSLATGARNSGLLMVLEDSDESVSKLTGNTGNLADAFTLATVRAQDMMEALSFKPGSKAGQPIAPLGLPDKDVYNQLAVDLVKVEANERKANKAAEEFKRTLEKIAEIQFRTSQANLGTLGTEVPINREFLGILESVAKIERTNSAIETTQAEIARLGVVVDPATEKMIRFWETFEEVGPTLEQARGEVQSFGDFLSSTLSESIVRVFEGGGNIGKTLGASIGKFFTGKNSVIGRAIGGIGGKLGGFLGSIVPGLGTLLGGLGGQLVGGLFGKLFKSEEKDVNKIRQAFIDLNGGWAEFNDRAIMAGTTLKRVLDARTVKQYEAAVKDLNAALEFQDQAMRFLDDTVKKYGFSIEELGPAFARQQLDKQAGQLFKEFQALTASGINVDTVIGKMGSSINAFVQQAIATGTEIPAAMAPMIQRMQEMGLLTDKSGKTITDLEASGVKFAMTMTDAFATLIEEVRKLTDAISRGLSGAIRDVPSVNVPIPRPGFGSPVDVIPMATGGRGVVTKPTLFLAGERGPEEFAFSGSGRSWKQRAEDASSGWRRRPSVTIDARGAILGSQAPAEIARMIANHLAKGGRDQTRMRGALKVG